MIHDTIENRALYESVHPRFAAALAWLREHAASAAPGRHEIEGKSLFVNVDHTASHAFDPAKFELHRRYVDIQFLFEGEEEIWVGPPEEMAVAVPFDEAKDVSWHRHEGAAGLHRVVMRPGDFLVLEPGREAHQPAVAPACAAPGGAIRKAIAKVLAGD